MGASCSFDRVRTYDQDIQQEVGTRLLNNYISKDTLQTVTDRRNSALEKNVKRVCDSQTTADIEEAMGEGRGDDDEEGESEDENEDVQGTRLADNTLETKRRKRDTDSAVSTSELV